MSEVKVEYIENDEVVITMSGENYRSLLKETNQFAQAMNHVTETFDFDLSDLKNMDLLRFSLRHYLGFEFGEHQWSNYKLPSGKIDVTTKKDAKG